MAAATEGYVNDVHRVGIEEELFVVDDGGRVVPRAREVIDAHRAMRTGSELVHELFLEQVELQTGPHDDADSLREDLVRQRSWAVDAAREVGLELAAVPVDVWGGAEPTATPGPRYEHILAEYGAIARGSMVCGMHVHVEVAQDDAIAVIDALRPWTPLLAALAANSPFSHGRDTLHASWRGHLRETWPSAGPVEPFGDHETYQAMIDRTIASGASIDEHMVYLDVRIATRYPTVEVRVADVCTEVDDAVLVAELTRALVATIVRDRREPGDWRLDLLRCAAWRSRRDGLDGTLLDPLTGAFVPAGDALESLHATVRAALAETGAAELVEDGIHRVLAGGNGASRQRAVAGPDGDLTSVMADLVRRTDPRRRLRA